MFCASHRYYLQRLVSSDRDSSGDVPGSLTSGKSQAACTPVPSACVVPVQRADCQELVSGCQFVSKLSALALPCVGSRAHYQSPYELRKLCGQFGMEIAT